MNAFEEKRQLVAEIATKPLYEIGEDNKITKADAASHFMKGSLHPMADDVMDLIDAYNAVVKYARTIFYEQFVNEDKE